ncbi:MAG: thioesterase domain-containing protein, partial [Acidimicrobiia bacterium]
FSSSSAIAIPAGQANYVGANAVLDALAGASCGSGRITTVNWSAWRERGMGATANRRNRLGIRPGRSFDHPVLTEVVDTANGAVLHGSLDRTRWVVSEHATDDGTALLPGAGIVELMAVACRHLGAPICEQIDLLTPLVVGAVGVTDVRVKVTAAGEDTWDLVLESAAPGAADWELHATATARGFGRVAAPEMPDAPAVDRVGDPFGVQRSRLRLGPRWSAIVDVLEAPGSHAVGTLALGEPYVAEASRWFAHPALVDTAIATAVHLVGQADGELVVPMSFGAVQLGEPLVSGATVHTAMRTNDHGHDVAVADLELINPDGQMAMRLNGLVLRTVRGPLSLPTIAAPVDGPVASNGPGLLALVDRSGLDHAEGADAFRRAMATGAPHLLISKISPAQLIAEATPAKRVVVAAASGASDGPALGGDRVSQAVGDAWRSLLGVASASPADDFFAMGGHSLIAVRLFAKIHQEFGVRMALTTLFDAPTLGELIEVVRLEVGDDGADLDDETAAADGTAIGDAASATSDGTSGSAGASTVDTSGTSGVTPSGVSKAPKSGAPARRAAQCLVPVKRSGDRSPLLCVHGRGGNVLGLMDLGRSMPEHRPFYGVQAFAVTGDRMPDRTISAMAARYVDGLLESGLRLPVHIAGYSGGGLIAIEMARILRTKGLPVGELILFDTLHPAAQGLGKGARVRNLVQNAAIHGPGSVMRWMRGRKEHAAMLARMESLTDDASMTDAGIVDLSDFFDLAAFRHRFDPIDIEAHLITVEEFDATAPKDNGWSDTDFRRLHRHQVAGNHLDMLAGEHARTLSRLLDEILTN